jgi:DnaJ-class molecular chaperone
MKKRRATRAPPPIEASAVVAGAILSSLGAYVMSDFPQTCRRCNGTGEIGKRTRGEREAPGPVPDDARGWYSATCPDCHGTGVIVGEEEDEDE